MVTSSSADGATVAAAVAGDSLAKKLPIPLNTTTASPSLLLPQDALGLAQRAGGRATTNGILKRSSGAMTPPPPPPPPPSSVTSPNDQPFVLSTLSSLPPRSAGNGGGSGSGVLRPRMRLRPTNNNNNNNSNGHFGTNDQQNRPGNRTESHSEQLERLYQEHSSRSSSSPLSPLFLPSNSSAVRGTGGGGAWHTTHQHHPNMHTSSSTHDNNNHNNNIIGDNIGIGNNYGNNGIEHGMMVGRTIGIGFGGSGSRGGSSSFHELVSPLGSPITSPLSSPRPSSSAAADTPGAMSTCHECVIGGYGGGDLVGRVGLANVQTNVVNAGNGGGVRGSIGHNAMGGGYPAGSRPSGHLQQSPFHGPSNQQQQPPLQQQGPAPFAPVQPPATAPPQYSYRPPGFTGEVIAGGLGGGGRYAQNDAVQKQRTKARAVAVTTPATVLSASTGSGIGIGGGSDQNGRNVLLPRAFAPSSTQMNGKSNNSRKPSISDTNKENVNPNITPVKQIRRSYPPPSSQKSRAHSPLPLATSSGGSSQRHPQTQTPSSASTTTTPPPQNLKGDPHRQAKVKTEICLYYTKNVECPFGDRCNYAHGFGELRFKRLKELEKNGLIPNAKTYRTHPCLSWVTTGSCPFGQRCTSIHDPRLGGSVNSWMPFADSPVAHLLTTINVDKFYHRHNGSLHATNPLVGNTYWAKCRPSLMTNRVKKSSVVTKSPHRGSEAQQWQDTYDLVCNFDGTCPLPSPAGSASRATASRRPLASLMVANGNGNDRSTVKKITEENRISMALIMSYGGADGLSPVSKESTIGSNSPRHDDYVYDPSHLVYNELCMILQTRYFRMNAKESNGSDLTSVREISIDEYNASTTAWNKSYGPNQVVVAREIAFGPVGEANANVSIWFDIPPTAIVSATPTMVRQFKRARNKSKQNGTSPTKKKDQPFPPLPFHQATKIGATESFHTVSFQPFFHMNQPINDDYTKGLIHSILLHRIRVLQFRQKHGSIVTCKALTDEEKVLQDRFWALKRDMEKWSWPVSADRRVVDADTTIPECASAYNPEVPDNNETGMKLSNLWNSFVNTIEDETKEEEDSMEEESIDSDAATTNVLGYVESAFSSSGRPRLPIFREITENSGFSGNNWKMPHINGRRCKNNDEFAKNDDWKQILLETDEEGSIIVNEWSLVKEHYIDEEKVASFSPSPMASKGSSPSNRDQALPLGSSGEKRESIFSKLNGGGK